MNQVSSVDRATMIEECGRVVAVEPGSVWVETAATSGCGRCQEAGGCGQNSIFRMLGARGRQLRVASGDLKVGVGDTAVIGVPGGALVRASLMAYLVPLLGLLAGAMIGHYASGGWDPAAVAGGFFGIGTAFAASRLASVRLATRIGLEPTLLSVSPANLGNEVGLAETAL